MNTTKKPNETKRMGSAIDNALNYETARRLYRQSNSNSYWMPWRKNKGTEREYQTNFRIQ